MVLKKILGALKRRLLPFGKRKRNDADDAAGPWLNDPTLIAAGLSARGRRATQPPFTYLGAFLAALQDPW